MMSSHRVLNGTRIFHVFHNFLEKCFVLFVPVSSSAVVEQLHIYHKLNFIVFPNHQFHRMKMLSSPQ